MRKILHDDLFQAFISSTDSLKYWNPKQETVIFPDCKIDENGKVKIFYPPDLDPESTICLPKPHRFRTILEFQDTGWISHEQLKKEKLFFPLDKRDYPLLTYQTVYPPEWDEQVGALMQYLDHGIEELPLYRYFSLRWADLLASKWCKKMNIEIIEESSAKDSHPRVDHFLLRNFGGWTKEHHPDLRFEDLHFDLTEPPNGILNSLE